MDVPFNDKPVENPALSANTFLPINTANFPSGNVLWSPRLGFNFDPTGSGETILRGGVGYFTGRPPYVWLSNAFVGTGLEQVDLTCNGAGIVPAFTVDPANQPTLCEGGGGATAARPSPSYFVDDFKFPQTFRISAGADHRLPWGLVGTVDFLYSKNVNQLYIQDANLVSRGPNSEGRFMYGTIGTTSTGAFSASPLRLTPSSGPGDRRRGAPQQHPARTDLPRHGAAPEELRLRGGVQRRLYLLQFQGRHLAHQQPGVLQLPVRRGRRAAGVEELADVVLPCAAQGHDQRHRRPALPDGAVAHLHRPLRRSLLLAGERRRERRRVNGNDLPFIPADPSQISLADLTRTPPSTRSSRARTACRRIAGGSWSGTPVRTLAELPERAVCGDDSHHRDAGTELSLDLFNVLNFIDREWGLYKQVSEFEGGPRFLNAAGYDTDTTTGRSAGSPRPRSSRPTVFGENPSGAQSASTGPADHAGGSALSLLELHRPMR
jgi:hypothetical protein